MQNRQRKCLYSLMCILIGVIGSLCYAMKKIVQYADTSLQGTDKYREYFILLNHWLMLKQHNINISGCFLKKGYSNIAVYGMGFIGIRLCDELKNTQVHIEKTFDRAANTIYHPLGVYPPPCTFRFKCGCLNPYCRCRLGNHQILYEQ